jgi:hypothetical protein
MAINRMLKSEGRGRVKICLVDYSQFTELADRSTPIAGSGIEASMRVQAN